MPYSQMKMKKSGGGSSKMGSGYCHTAQPKAPPGQPSVSKDVVMNTPKKTEKLAGR
jgi:hypothetical protein